MMQFVSDSILDASNSCVALPITHSGSACPGVPVDSRLTKPFADTWVRLKRHLRTHRLEPGSLWIDDALPYPVVLLATHNHPQQISISNLRKALRRLARWADRNRLKQVCVASCSGTPAVSESTFRQVAFQLLIDSRCQFYVHESAASNQQPNRSEVLRTPLSRFVSCGSPVLTGGPA